VSSANWITLSRWPLLFVSVVQLQLGSAPVRLVGAALLLIGLILDSLDGVVARRTGGTSLVGSVLDIAADRTYELVLWVFFTHLGLVPVAIPLIVIARTTLTDALRSIEVSRGMAPFDQPRGRLGRFLVASAWMRSGYAASKIASFVGLALVQAHAMPMTVPLHVISWFAVTLCVLRGLPVVAVAASSVEFDRKNRSAPRRPG
jgi:phosphatidylglycerophosphate synthase